MPTPTRIPFLAASLVLVMVLVLVLALVLAMVLPPALAAQRDPTGTSGVISLRLKDCPLTAAVAAIGRVAGANVRVEEGIDETITIDLDAGWSTALDMVAEKAGCVVVHCSQTLHEVVRPPRVFFSGVAGRPVAEVIDEIARHAGRKILVDPDVQGAITLRFNRPWRELLEATVDTLGYAVVEEPGGVLRVTRRDAASGARDRESSAQPGLPPGLVLTLASLLVAVVLTLRRVRRGFRHA